MSKRRSKLTAREQGRADGIRTMLETEGADDWSAAELTEQAEILSSFQPDTDRAEYFAGFLAGANEVAPLA